MARREWAGAAALYAGPFAAGFTLAHAPGFEEWLDDERWRLAHEGHKALGRAAQEAEAAGDLARALPHWRRLVSSEPLSTHYALGYVRALSGLGECAEALEHARAHAARIRRELDAEPDPELGALIAELRPRPTQPAPPPRTDTPPDVHPDGTWERNPDGSPPSHHRGGRDGHAERGDPDRRDLGRGGATELTGASGAGCWPPPRSDGPGFGRSGQRPG